MTRYQAITESGSEYMIDTDRHLWINRREAHKYGIFVVIDREEVDGLDQEALHRLVREKPQATKPEVGKALYFSYIRSWGLSTTVVSVIELEDEEDDDV